MPTDWDVAAVQIPFVTSLEATDALLVRRGSALKQILASDLLKQIGFSQAALLGFRGATPAATRVVPNLDGDVDPDHVSTKVDDLLSALTNMGLIDNGA